MKVRIEIDESELVKLDNYTILEKVTPEVEEEEILRSYFSGYTDFSEIHEADREEILRCAKNAIEEGAYGIVVDIESGRDCRDHRCYTFIGCHVVSSKSDNEYPDYKVSDLKKHLEENK